MHQRPRITESDTSDAYFNLWNKRSQSRARESVSKFYHHYHVRRSIFYVYFEFWEQRPHSRALAWSHDSELKLYNHHRLQ